MDLESTLLLVNNTEDNILEDLPVVDCMPDVTSQFLLINDPSSTPGESPSLLVLKDANPSETESDKKDDLQTVNLLNTFNYIRPVSQSTSQEQFHGASIQVLDVIETLPQQALLTSVVTSQETEIETKVKKARVRKKATPSVGLSGTKRNSRASSGKNSAKKTKKRATEDTSEPPIPSNLSLPVISDMDKIVRTGIVTTTSSNEPPTLSVPDEENVISVATNGHPKRRLTQHELRQIGLLLDKKKTFRRNDHVKKVICRVIYPDDVDDELPKPIKRPKKPNKKKTERKVPEIKPSPSDCELLVTRSGRVSKRPKNYNRVLKILLKKTRPSDDFKSDNFMDYFKKDQEGDEEDDPVATQVKSNETAATNSNVQLLNGLERVRQKKKTFITCPTCNKDFTPTLMWRHVNKYAWHVDTETYNNIQVNHPFTQIPQKRQTSRLSVRSRLNRLEANQNHRKAQLKKVIKNCKKDEFIAAAASRFTSSLSTWQFLLLKMRHGRNSSRSMIQTFLKEVKETAEEAANWAPKFLSNSSHELKTGKIVHIEDDTLSKILRIEKGLYRVNEGEIKKLTTPTTVTSFVEEPDLDRSDSNELLQDMMLLDKSTMDTVDQLVNERLQSLAPGPDDLISPPVEASTSSHHPLHHHHHHHINSDDDLMSNLLMTAVGDVVPPSCDDISATADDLLKSLETLGPPTLDFTALSNEYNPVR